jgi:hypothetical protein
MQCFDSALGGRKGGHHHAGDTGIRLLQPPYEIDTASGTEPHVDQRDVRGKARDGPPGGPFLVYRQNLESLQRQEVGGAIGEVAVVIDDENPPPKPHLGANGGHAHADTLDEAAESGLSVSDITVGWREEVS